MNAALSSLHNTMTGKLMANGATARCACVADDLDADADYKEEQEMEVEALESIYMDEFKKLTEDPLSYQVHIVPNQDGQNNHVAVVLKCMIPATYPDVEPQLELIVERGLSDTQYKEVKQILVSQVLQSIVCNLCLPKIGRLTMVVNDQVAENVGMAMIYTLCEAVREYLVENNIAGNDGSEYHEMMRRMDQKKKKDDHAMAAVHAENAAKAETKRAFVGTPVTVETFNAWKTAFEAEIMMSKAKVTVKDEATAKLTGRMLWSQGLVDDKNEDLDGEALDDDESDEDYVEGEEEDKCKYNSEGALRLWLAVSERFELDAMYAPSMENLHLRLFQLDEVFRFHLPVVHQHLSEREVHPSAYATRWVLTLFTDYRVLNEMCVIRFLDVFFQTGWKAFFRVYLAILATIEVRANPKFH
ncbi:TPA: hypothetical protein N0F65_009074 [Lagenidium giganteum]|uniref:RWD domain-containing protein n=1 Tax=Lagenidium giganteum TaxID=4803 RepID=A0AAV2YLK6_9STRA|nr:TPA: hypothetical protein N0F65_009074 [Lagenidium giganteum]